MAEQSNAISIAVLPLALGISSSWVGLLGLRRVTSSADELQACSASALGALVDRSGDVINSSHEAARPDGRAVMHGPSSHLSAVEYSTRATLFLGIEAPTWTTRPAKGPAPSAARLRPLGFRTDLPDDGSIVVNSNTRVASTCGVDHATLWAIELSARLHLTRIPGPQGIRLCSRPGITTGHGTNGRASTISTWVRGRVIDLHPVLSAFTAVS